MPATTARKPRQPHAKTASSPVTTTASDPWADPIEVAGTTSPGLETHGTVMVTGHRPQALTPAEQAWSQVTLAHTVWRLRSVYGMRHAITGMALGADLWFATAAMAAGAHLHAYLPFATQTDGWPETEKTMWAEILRRTKTTTTLLDRKPADRGEAVRYLHARNDAMLEATAQRLTNGGGGLVLAVLTSEKAAQRSGGTASAVEKARKRGLPLLICDPSTRTIRRDGW